MRFIKRLLTIMLTIVFILGAFGSVKVDAKEITIATPKISIKVAKFESGIKVSIGKTKDAEGYLVYLTFKADNSLYKDGNDLFCDDNFSCKDKLVKKIELSGAKKRTVTLKAEELINENCKSLPAGKYTIKVKSYNTKKYGAIKYSEYSKSKSLKIEDYNYGYGYQSSYDFSNVKKGDIITFGAYEQDGNFYNGREPIEWVVLKKTKKQIFVVSKYVLDRLPYNNQQTNVTWETCTLRKWLNDKFYNAAFNKSEKHMIKTTTVENYDNAEKDTPGGEDTNDKVFLLSQLDIIESDYGFADKYAVTDINRRCAPSNYAIVRGVFYDNVAKDDEFFTAEGLRTCVWWLRTPGTNNKKVCCTYNVGCVVGYGFSVSRDYNHRDFQEIDYGSILIIGVRPAMCINIESE
ncbi:MAG: hypothetical protein IKP88_09595 [Lachnospiraceae bacterium]|nr:hypothetical protein [Lachnospiraceae bacterium]